MRRRPLALALALSLSIVGAGTALSAVQGEPQKRITPADQARAKAMVLRKSDLGFGFSSFPVPSNGGGYDCAALDESDLTLTGEAWSPAFTRGTSALFSSAQVYRTRLEADTSWRRGTSAAGLKCVRASMARQVQGSNVRIVSFRPLELPRLAHRTAGFRVVAAQQQGLRMYLDLVVLQQSRAHASFFVTSALEAPPRSEVVRLARLTARRMATAMRGS